MRVPSSPEQFRKGSVTREGTFAIPAPPNVGRSFEAVSDIGDDNGEYPQLWPNKPVEERYLSVVSSENGESWTLFCVNISNANPKTRTATQTQTPSLFFV